MVDHLYDVRTLVYLGRECDEPGQTAAKGKVVAALMEELMARTTFPFCSKCLDFGSSYDNNILARYSTASTKDLAATFTHFTTASVTVGGLYSPRSTRTG